METSLTTFKNENENAIVEYYKKTSIRQTEIDGKLYISIKDLENACGVDADTFIQRARRHPENYVVHTRSLQMKSPSGGGVQLTKFIDAIGANKLIDETSIYTLKKQEVRNQFQKWREEKNLLIEQFKHQQIQKQQPPRLSVAQVVEEHLQIANAMSTHAHVDRGIAASLALALAEYKTGEDLKPWKNLIVKDRQEPAGVLTPTQIGIELGGLSGQSVNRILKRLGFQYWAGGEGGQWVLTRRGEAYAELIPITVYSKSRDLYYPRYQTKWQPRILEVVRRALDPEIDTRQGLLSGEVNYIFPR